MKLALRLLGQPEIEVDGRPQPNLPGAKMQALVYYLAVTGEAHSRHALAGLLWGDAPEEKAKNSLRVALAGLRKRWPDLLDVNNLTVAIAPDVDLWLDTRFLAATLQSSGDTATRRAALDHYRGEFLESFSVGGAPDFDEWQAAQRDYWRRLVAEGLADLSAQQLAAGAFETAAATLARRIALDATDEDAHRDLMLAHARRADLDAALAQYDACRHALQETLQLSPTPATTALQQRLLAAREDAARPLPDEPTPFLGRAAELDQVQALLSQPDCRLVTITGIGGMGKTRLALAAARHTNGERRRTFLNGVVFVGLQDADSAAVLPQTIAIALALRLAGRRPAMDQITTYLQSREMLLVLDNFEHLLDGVEQLIQLLDACPLVKMLVTSREPLQVAAEWRVDLAGLDFPTETGDAPPTNYAASRLFLQTATAVQPDFAPSVADVANIYHICRLVEGVPLAIKLAAYWLRSMDTAAILAALQRGLDILATELSDLPPRQRSLRAVFDATWSHMPGAEQSALAACAIFQGPFAREAAQAIADVSLGPLAALVDRGLVHAHGDPSPNGGRSYQLHELIRQYASEHLDETRRLTLRRAHRQHYAAQLAEWTVALLGPEQKSAFASIERASGNVRRAWRDAVDERDVATLTQMVDGVFRFFLKQGWFDEGSDLLATAVATLEGRSSFDEATRSLLGHLNVCLGALISHVGRLAEAEAALRQGIEIAQRVEEPELIAFALIEIARLHRERGQFADARRCLEEGLAIAQELGDRRAMAQAMHGLATADWDTGSHIRSQARLRETLELVRELGDLSWIGRLNNSLGNVTMSAGHNDEAQGYFEEALAIFRDLEDWLMLDTVLINLGMVTNQRGEHARSRAYYEESLAICRRIGDDVGVAYCLTGIGQAAHHSGDLETARRLVGESLAMNRAMGRDRYVGINLNALGDIARSAGDLDEATAHSEEALGVFTRLDHPWGLAASHNRLGDLAVSREEFAAAKKHYTTAVRHAHAADIEGTLWSALMNVAAVMMRQGELAPALLTLQHVAQQPRLDDASRTDVDRLLQEAQETHGATADALSAAAQKARDLTRAALLAETLDLS